MNDIKKTVLYNAHKLLGAKIVPFAGYKMPISYTKGIHSEYFSIRKKVGMFDVSHMGQFKISGPKSYDFLQNITINNVSKLKVGDAQYSAMCYEDGGIVDDLILYKKKDSYLMVVNAANIEKNFDWMDSQIIAGVNIENLSSKISLIALQGPESRNILSKITNLDLHMPFYKYKEGLVNNHMVLLSRTGYTGELGFEIYAKSIAIQSIWDVLINMGVEPAGLAARDILRLEMNYCLYGNDINKNTNPIEAGLSWITSFNKKEFIGSKAIKEVKQIGLAKKLVGFKMLERGIPRSNYIVYKENIKIGKVTSGVQSPILNCGIGLAYIDVKYNNIGEKIDIQIRDKKIKAKIVKPPFINNTSLYK